MKNEFHNIGSVFSLREENTILKRRIKGFEQITEKLSKELDQLRRLNNSMQKTCTCQKLNSTQKVA